IGAGLGYPSCCVESFCRRYVARKKARSRAVMSPDFMAARDAWTLAACWPLNSLLRATRCSVISFRPCRYCCPAALSWADPLLGVPARADPAGRKELELALRGRLVIAPSGARARVTLAPGGGLAAAEAVRHWQSDSSDPQSTELARRLPGTRPSAAGKIEGLGNPPPLLISFDV